MTRASVENQASAKAMFHFASPPNTYDRDDVQQQQRILAETFAGIGWEVPRLLHAMWDAPDFYFDVAAQVCMERWSNGRVALLGDAAYSPSPLTGLGTSLAIVGAYVWLANWPPLLTNTRWRSPRTKELRDYVEQGQTLPPGGVNGFLPRTRTSIWLRNQSMRMMTARPLRGLLAGTFRKADAMALKDYAHPPIGDIVYA